MIGITDLNEVDTHFWEQLKNDGHKVLPSLPKDQASFSATVKAEAADDELVTHITLSQNQIKSLNPFHDHYFVVIGPAGSKADNDAGKKPDSESQARKKPDSESQDRKKPDISADVIAQFAQGLLLRPQIPAPHAYTLRFDLDKAVNKLVVGCASFAPASQV